MNQDPKKMLIDMVDRISEIMAMMDQFQVSRAGDQAFIKLEEAIMWLQVMANSVPLKPLQQNEGEVIDAEQKVILD